MVSNFAESGPFVLDSWLDLRCVQLRWDSVVETSAISLLGLALDVTKSLACSPIGSFNHLEKAYVLLVLLCCDVVSNPGNLVSSESAGEESRSIYCLALIKIVEGSLQYPSIGRLAASKLVDELTLLSTQHVAVGADSDIWV